MKQKRCKQCNEPFTPQRMGQKVCSPACAIPYARNQSEKSQKMLAKAERMADRAKREKLKTRSDWMKDAQREFNKYIRLRDAGMPCICCGGHLEGNAVGGGFDAGHYRSVGSAPHLRFDERNVHGQRKQCNRYGAGRAVDYRIGLITRIGLAAVEAVEADQTPRKYTIEDLKQIIATYRAKCKELEKA
ncbi:MAG TPA: recombination protein NinG [Pseudomonadales bacterium]|nr:recombination protein NinG [Pseudomonadales bacterium]